MDWKDKKVAILGWGLDTQDVEPWLRGKGAEITILDEKDDPSAFANLDEFEVLVRAPGVYRYRPEIVEAEKKGILVTSKMKIFFDETPTRNIIGVTGTKGKGTTATLTHHMLKAAGKDVYLGGNMGKGVFSFFDLLKPESWVVLELSSFQLIDLDKSPHIAVVLMVTSDHLDWHKDVDEYVDAKSQITKYQGPDDFLIFNDQYPNSVKIGMMGQGKKIAISRNDWKAAMRIRGEHNRENMVAAATVAKIVGVDDETIRKIALEFKGLEHRLEEVGQVNGVTYYDDSISTTPETAIAAIQAFSEPMVLILGGSDKGADFTNLGKVIGEAKNIKAVILMGLMAEKIKAAIVTAKAKIKILEGAKSMAEVIGQAKSVATSGDVIVLSPACASFDMFKNYKDRGEQFKAEVK